MAWFSRIGVALTLALAGCDDTGEDATPAGSSSSGTGSSGAPSTAETGLETSTSSGAVQDETTGASGSDSSSSSTGLGEPFERPEGCDEVDACTLDCFAESQFPYLFGCGVSQCSVGLDAAEEDVQCAIEALRDAVPGRVVVDLSYTELNEDDFIEEYLVFEIAPTGRILRASVERQYDIECCSDYDTDVWLPKVSRSSDDPIWAACLEPEPDLNCLLGAELFEEGCFDEPFVLCE